MMIQRREAIQREVTNEETSREEGRSGERRDESWKRVEVANEETSRSDEDPRGSVY